MYKRDCCSVVDVCGVCVETKKLKIVVLVKGNIIVKIIRTNLFIGGSKDRQVISIPDEKKREIKFPVAEKINDSLSIVGSEIYREFRMVGEKNIFCVFVHNSIMGEGGADEVIKSLLNNYTNTQKVIK